MKSQNFKRIIVVLLVTALAVAIPSSFAKYMGDEHFTMTVSKKLSFMSNTSSTAMGKQTITLPYPGRYAIIVKGGDGSNGATWKDGSSNFNIEGGMGAVVAGVYTTSSANQKLVVAPGGAGGRPYLSSGYGAAGPAGTNSGVTAYNGGLGASIEAGMWDLFGNLAKNMSKEPSGGGGGAASVVYVCDSNGNYDSSRDLLFVAGGGGAAGNWNQAYEDGLYIVFKVSYSVKAGAGGSAVGNYSNGTLSIGDSIDVSSVDVKNGSYVVTSSKVIAGQNGDGGSKSFGYGGSTSAGNGGSVSAAALGAMAKGNAGGGDGSTGGYANYYGGGGGGGYFGGGGGAGTSLEVASGGGGGGSSLISDLIIQDGSVDYASIISEAQDASTCDKKNGVIPTQYPLNNNSGEGAGYIIIKYLGPVEGGTSVPTKETKTFNDIMTDIVNMCSSSTGKTIKHNSTTDALYKKVMEDPCVSKLLSGRAWQISVDNSGNVTIYFTNDKSTSNGYNKTVWRYKSGSLMYSNSVRLYNNSLVTSSNSNISGITDWKSGTFTLT